MTNRQRIRLVDYKRKKYVKSATKLFRKVLNYYSADLMQRIDGMTDLALINQEAAKPIDSAKIQQAMAKLYVSVGSDFAKWEIKQINEGAKAARKPIQVDFWEAYFESYAETEILSKVVWITGTTEEIFRRTVDAITRQGALDGVGVWEMMNQLRDQLNFTNQYRAERIARTETIRASNAGSFEGAKNSGVRVKKEWIHSGSMNERPEHADMDGQPPIEMDQPFHVMGEDIMIPGEGSAENSINCGCCVGYVPETNEEMYARWDKL